MNRQNFWRRPQAVLLSVALALGMGGVGFASAARLGYLHPPLAFKMASPNEGPSRGLRAGGEEGVARGGEHCVDEGIQDPHGIRRPDAG